MKLPEFPFLPFFVAIALVVYGCKNAQESTAISNPIPVANTRYAPMADGTTTIMNIEVSYTSDKTFKTIVSWTMDEKLITEKVSGYRIKIKEAEGVTIGPGFCNYCNRHLFEEDLSPGDYQVEVVARGAKGEILDRTRMSAGFVVSKKGKQTQATSAITVTRYNGDTMMKIVWTLDKLLETVEGIDHFKITITAAGQQIAEKTCDFSECRSADFEKDIHYKFYTVTIVARDSNDKELPETKLKAGFKWNN